MAREDELLDLLPLEILVAFQSAVADPTADGQERAHLFAKSVGFHIFCTMRPDGCEGARDPLPMPPPDNLDDGVVRFNFDHPHA